MSNLIISFTDCRLESPDRYVLGKINSTDMELLVNEENQKEVDCGLISILLAICYDVRSTFNEPTSESPWTRTILSSTLTYFEVFDSVKSVVECFLRRSLIYPLYRNYDFSTLCIDDAINALRKGRKWILKQLLTTYQMFRRGNDKRDVLNRLYLKGYINYVKHCVDSSYLFVLSENLKNVCFDVTKKSLRLGLTDIEKELLKELIEDMHSSLSSGDDSELDDDFEDTEGDDDEDDDEDNDEEEDDDDDEESSSSQEEDTNSVIENKT